MMYRFFEKDRLLPIPRRVGLKGPYRGRGVGIAYIDSGFHPHPDLTWPNRIAVYRDFTAAGPGLFDRPDVLTWHGLQTSVVGAGNGALSRGRYRSCAPESHVALLKVKERSRIRLDAFLDCLWWLMREGKDYGIRLAVFAVAIDENVDRQGNIAAAIEALSRAGVCTFAAAGNSDQTPLVPPASAPAAITVGGYVDNNSSQFRRFTPYPGPRSQTKPDLLAPAAHIPTPLHPEHPLFLQSQVIWRLLACPDERLRESFERERRFLGLPANSRRLGIPAMRAVLRARVYAQKFVTEFYQHGDGTSFAAPIAASVAACMLEAHPRLTPQHLKEILSETAVHRIGPVPVLSASRAVDRAVREKSTIRMAG